MENTIHPIKKICGNSHQQNGLERGQSTELEDHMQELEQPNKQRDFLRRGFCRIGGFLKRMPNM